MRIPARHGEVCPGSQCRTNGRLGKPNFYGRTLSIRVCLGHFQPELHPIKVDHDVSSRGMPLVIILDRHGKLPASQANVERQEHGSVQHETVSDWEVRPQQHMDQLAKSHGGDWQPWTTDPGNPALLMPFVTRGRSAASAVVSGSPRQGGVEKKIAPTATIKERGEEAPMPCTVRGLPQTLEPGPSSRFQPPRPSNDCPCACFARFWLSDGCPGSFQAGPVTWKRTV